MKFVVVEGNIGSGKTTFLNEIKKRYNNVVIIEEPVNEWYTIKDENNESLFEKFYKDAKRYGYLFQTNVLATRFKKIMNTINRYSNEDKIILCERSILTDKHIFVSAALELGNLNKMEADVFNHLFEICLSTTHMKIDAILYLQCDPEISFDRLRQRNRKGEENMPFEYISLLHDKHEKWLTEEENDTQVHVIDNTKEIDLDSIYSFLTKM